MPNTLAHLGVQSLITRAALPQADLKWIYLGCVMPDIPWIGQRLARQVLSVEWLIDVRLYAMVQSSLFFCLLLAAAMAVWSRRSKLVFAVLGLGAVLHLLLDATQTKWGNGVHLFAPISWELASFDWYWPEGLPTVVLSLIGLAFVAVMWRGSLVESRDLRIPRGVPLAVGTLCLAIYILAPPLFFSDPIAADNHSIQVLQVGASREGQPVEFDRRPYVKDTDGGTIVAFTGERFRLVDMPDTPSGTVSLKGTFLDSRTIMVRDRYLHARGLRDIASYLGLAFVVGIWVFAIWQRWRPMGAPQ